MGLGEVLTTRLATFSVCPRPRASLMGRNSRSDTGAGCTVPMVAHGPNSHPDPSKWDNRTRVRARSRAPAFCYRAGLTREAMRNAVNHPGMALGG